MGGSLFDASPSSLHPLSKVDLDAEFVTVTFDVPGVDREDISVTCTDDTVSIEAEMRKSFRTGGPGRSESTVEYVRYSNRILLPVAVDPNGRNSPGKSLSTSSRRSSESSSIAITITYR